MKRGTRILCSIFGFYLTLVLLVPQFAAACYGQFFNRAALIHAFCTETVAEQVMEQVLADGAAIANGCGIPATVYDGVFSAGQIQQDMSEALSCALDGNAYAPDLSENLELLTENIGQTLIQLDDVENLDDYQQSIAAFCDQIQETYQRYISLSVFRRFAPVCQTATRWLGIATLVAVATGLLCLVLLWRLARQRGMFLREFSFSLVASGGLNALLSAGLLQSGVLAKLQVSPVYVRDALGSFFHDGLRLSLYVALGVVLLGIFLFVLALIRMKSDSE